MKRLNLYFIISVLLLSAVGCTQREDTKIPNPTFETSFTAIMEGGDQTKALLGETLDDGSRALLWEPGDSIKIFCRSVDYVANYTGHIYVNREKQNSTQAIFEGSMCRSFDVLAVYPHSLYSYQPYWDSGEGREYYTSHIDFPKVQIYRENNIAKESVPMAAFKTLTPENNYTLQGELEFRNLYGVLVLNLTGNDKVRSITITAKDSTGQVASLSGFGEIIRTEDSFYKVNMHTVIDGGAGMPMAESGSPAITLECPDVQLNPMTATPFHIALPPGKYSSFSLLITTSDGKMMVKESNKELVIKRSTLKHTVPLTYTETIPVNLSERGTSNSYIVEKAGIYTFDASVIGNGAAGIKPYADFHTADPSISPASVELLWEDTSGLISALNLDTEDKTISFMASGMEGNALIAAKDEDGTIIWSWHIWCTDKPKEHTYINYQNQTFNVLDRNLGATRADRGTGEEWKESVGLHYQWGRKDPFTVGNLHSDNTLTINQTIENPTRTGPWRWMNESSQSYNTYMNLWSDSLKTIYDPCPVGYKVAPNAIWTGFSKIGLPTYGGNANFEDYNVSGTFDKGWNFIYDGTNTAWYPVTCSDSYSVSDWYGDDGRYWSSTYSSTNDSHRLYFRYYDDFSCDLHISSNASGEIHVVRCVADEGYVDISLPTLSTPSVTNIGNTTATFSAEATDQGGSAVIQKGFVWSKSHKPTIDLDTKIIVSSDTGKYSANISNLEQMSGYYVRAFATNSHGTGYGEEFFFSTKYDGIPTNLSNNGTSNCYIVSEEGYFGFDASTIGNGTQGIIHGAGFHTSDPSISPVSAEIVWEDTEDLITYLYFDEIKKTINFWASGKEGNALIAAKDGDGSIVWSWHIWSTDKPADHSYFNHNMKNYIVMDRNIGATRADRGAGEEWKESAGLIYQWGRKDPFAMNRYTYTSEQQTIAESIQKPNTMSTDSDWSKDSWTGDYKLWTDTLKTIYDPCPLGYRMPAPDVWSGFTTTGSETTNMDEFNISGYWDKGYWFYYDGVNTAWYPATYNDRYYGYDENSGRVWTGIGNQTSGRQFTYDSIYPIVTTHWWGNSGDCRAVRCVKDQVYNDPSMPNVLTTSVTNITQSQAKLSGEVTSEGTFGVTERGFVWNIHTDGKSLNIDTANKEVVGSGTGSFEVTLTTLAPGTNYFFRSYAISANGTVYGETLYFKTKETGSNEDLGEDEHEW